MCGFGSTAMTFVPGLIERKFGPAPGPISTTVSGRSANTASFGVQMPIDASMSQKKAALPSNERGRRPSGRLCDRGR